MKYPTTDAGEEQIAAAQADWNASSTSWRPVPGLRDLKLAERVAANLEAEVIAAGWPVGALIGTEEQLLARYGVGRAVLREAFRLTEHRQIARVRLGRNGGLVVIAPTSSAVEESLAIYLDYVGVSVEEIFEVRSILESFSVVSATTGIDEEHVAMFRNLAEVALTNGASANLGGQQFHELIAEATGNVALSLFIHALTFLTAHPRDEASTSRSEFKSFDDRVRNDHAEISKAILTGDELMAREAMVKHVKYLRDRAARPRKNSRVDNGIEPRELDTNQSRGSDLQRSAATVATRIRDEIVQKGWPVGQSLGFENELLERYGVGRAQFREAARILESHSVIQMRRGIGGGMVITAPDSQATMRAGALYLRFRNVQSVQIRDLREELEVASVRLAIERLNADGIVTLERVVEREQNWSDDQFPVVSHDLHGVIADLSGNRPLALLISILMQITAEKLYSGDPARVTEPPDAIRKAHQAIVAAIIDRDVPLASRRIRKHLRAVASYTV